MASLSDCGSGHAGSRNRCANSGLTNFRRPYSDGFDLSSLGLPAYMREGMVDPLSLPAIQITGHSVAGSIPNVVIGGLIGATDLIRFGMTTQTAQGNFTKNFASQTLKFGGEFRVVQFNTQQTGDTATNFNFTPAWTQGPNPAQSSAIAGLGLATFLFVAVVAVRLVALTSRSCLASALRGNLRCRQGCCGSPR